MFLFLIQLPVPPLAIRNESATRAGVSQFILFKVGLFFAYCLSPASSKQVSSSAAVSAAAAVKQHHKDPIKTAPQTCPASTFTLLTRSTVKDISICLHCIVLHLHCVALCRSRLPVGQSRLLYFSDRYTLGAHLFYHSLPFPPSPIRVTTIHITLDAISRRNTTTSLLSSPATISLSLSPSPPRSFS